MDKTASEDNVKYNDPGYGVFKQKFKKITGIDLNSYKDQIHRRTHMLMQRWGLKDKEYEKYFETIEKNDEKLREFLDYLTINVSEFFRNDSQWWRLRDTILPDLIKLRGNKRIKLWSCGCATGEEPYSLAILSIVLGLDLHTPVLAVDIDDGAMAIAKKGQYLKRQLTSVPKDYLARFFTTTDGENYAVTQEVKNRVTFKKMNMIEDRFADAFDLILCRNVVIYFTPETKTHLYKKFSDALAPGGYFLVGSTEQIFEYKSLGLENSGSFLYRKPISAAGRA
ncbi:MAG: protein-glutamate O-methyltransferase CheR [Synergistaceae bacterium]|nr:protein-glutamate O-methyltransferase CheR [Synergistaceae bacterium]